MKVAVLSESPADEAAVWILVQGLLDVEGELVPWPTPKTRGWRGVLNSADPVLHYLHYSTDADALVITLDSDLSPVHQRGHDQPGGAADKCGLCQLRATVDSVQSQLRPREKRGPIQTALGLAVPAVEAWYLAGRDPHVSETTWLLGMESGKFPYTKLDLKQMVYGTERPSLALEQQCAVEHARRLVQEEKLELLENLFPSGFGTLAADVRSWRATQV